MQLMTERHESQVNFIFQSSRYCVVPRKWFYFDRLFFYLGTPSSQNPQMDGWDYVTNSQGYGASLISRHWILRHTPYFEGRWENVQNLAEKYDDALIWRVIMTKQLNLKKLENKLAQEG